MVIFVLFTILLLGFPMKEAMLYESMSGGSVKCNLCGRRCVIPEGKTGFCRVRRNVGGKLYSLVYSKICSVACDPIEKKPLFHFNPGASVLSIATIGCNFRCLFCDNWVISQEEEIYGRDLPPEKIVELALRNDCQGISYTYTEPTIFFEYAYDTAKIAKSKGLFNTFVTNGYMTPEAVDTIAPYLDAATVDFKCSANPEAYRSLSSVFDVQPIFDCLLELKRKGVFIEVTNLLIPGIDGWEKDLENLARWIDENLGSETPFHILRFHPDYKLYDRSSTPSYMLKKAYEISRNSGLKHVYIGNAPELRLENTYCPQCGQLLIERYGFQVLAYNVTEDLKCPKCGYNVNVRGRFWASGGWIRDIL
ncbi:MAG: AmmeMemoRadiSam system radical SAM enzyme [archaeon GBS-70-058]|nr:AmmeMemoRadiSam system radical SAM enzyme [Candidatus Culexarchaeum nevadense]